MGVVEREGSAPTAWAAGLFLVSLLFMCWRGMFILTHLRDCNRYGHSYNVHVKFQELGLNVKNLCCVRILRFLGGSYAIIRISRIFLTIFGNFSNSFKVHMAIHTLLLRKIVL